MSDTVKIIIEIPKATYEDLKSGKIYSSLCEAPQGLVEGIRNGIPLDDVKADISEKMVDYVAMGYADSAEDFEEYSRIVNQAFDNIGKGDSE